jgi:dolichol-phosphate mannosyltransferase
LLNIISEVPVQPGGSDFRLMDHQAVVAFRHYREHARFIRGIIGSMGFNQIQVHFTAPPRFAGVSKFSPKKMLRLAIDGVFTCSTFPLRIGLYAGVASMFASFLLILHVLYETFVQEATVAGWPSIMACILFFGGMQLLVLGLIGEYLGRTYEETKRRPLYLLERGKPRDLKKNAAANKEERL